MSSNNFVRHTQPTVAGNKRQRPDDPVASVTSQSQYNKLMRNNTADESSASSQPGAGVPAAAAAHGMNEKRKRVKGKIFHSVPGHAEGNGQPKPLHGIPDSDSTTPFLTPTPSAKLADLAGVESVVDQIRELVFVPVQHPEVYKELGVRPPCGILLRGPSGCGKTHLANAVASELGLPYFRASGPELIAMASSPSILFLDAIDVIAAKTDGQRGMDRRVIAQLLEYVGQKGIGDASYVVLICASSKPDNLDPSLRGRLSREISLPVPDAPARARRITPGFVGADLRALCREAGMLAAARVVRDNAATAATAEERFDMNCGNEAILAEEYVRMGDFEIAMKSVQPSAKREGFAVVPDVSWADVGALASVRDELQHNVLEPIANPERFRALGLEVPAGVLFFGPPGCGKTLLAKAVANQSGANFISVKGPELLNMYVGESESRVRQVFSRARASAPCVIFFDELDALCPRRGTSDSGNGVSERVVNQLLTELDGLESRKDVYIIAATNRLELIDDAMLRPGRLGKLLYVPLPAQEDREDILSALTRKVNVDAVSLKDVSADPRTSGFSGADLAALVREAGLEVIREDRTLATVPYISRRHFDRALDRCRPSVREEDRLRYERVHSLIQSGVGAIQALQKVRDE
eukprot:GSChrysophyteH1.ASY1.ANO1.57.1 assembled CDS